MPDPVRPLNLADLDRRHPGLTPAIAACYREAASVCLDRHHRPPTVFAADCFETCYPLDVSWLPTDVVQHRAWRNETETTELGAYCLALAALEETHGLVAVLRAETRTGADYYVAAPEDFADHIETCLRLEVSGLDRGERSDIRKRLNTKLRQAMKGHCDTPALVSIVAFRTKTICVRKVA